MSLVVLTFLIGVLNLCAGYVVAVRLGYGPPSLLDTWDILTSGYPVGVPAGGYATVVEEEVEEPSDEAVQATLRELDAAPIENMLDDEPPEEMEIEPFDEPYDEDAAALLNPDVPENWDLNEKYVETSILKLNIAMMKSGAKATEIDTRLRSVEGHSDAETVRRCLEELKDDCETYLAEQTEAGERFSKRIVELGELESLGEEIEVANLEQVAQVETTVSNLEHMDFESDLEAANLRLQEEISHLRIARHKLRDNQEKAFLVIARYEDRMEKIEERLFQDPLTGLRNRIGLETILWQWWKQGRPRSRQINAVLFDVDGFNQINEEHGSLIGDRILYQLGQFIHRKVGTVDLTGCFAGQRFLTMMLDVGPRTATKNAEMIRQSIEQISFVHEEKEIRVTVTGAITEITPEDEVYEAFFERLEKTMTEAKKAGPNCSFACGSGQLDGEPKLIESPNFGAEPVDVSI